MLNPESLAALLRAPAESLRVDFKERLGWNKGKKAQLEVVRDLACFANRDGGTIIVGVRQSEGGRFELTGLRPDDDIPDVTVVNVLSRELFGRPIGCQIQVLPALGKDFAVVSIPEFADEPFIAIREAAAEGQTVFGKGDLIFRTAAMQCQRAGPTEFRQLMDRSMQKRGATLSRLFSDVPVHQPGQVAPTRDEFALEAFAKYPSLRATNLRPTVPVAPKRIRELEKMLALSRIPTQGTALFPRYLTTYNSDSMRTFRLPDALVIEAEAQAIDSDGRHVSAIRVTKSCVVNARESLWEDLHERNQKTVDITTMVNFVYASLTFGHRFFRLAKQTEFDYELGLIGPLGRTLWSDPRRWPLVWIPTINYRATSTVDLWVTRRVAVEALSASDDRANVAYDIVEEMLDYFGFELPRTLFDSHLAEVRARWPSIDGLPPEPPETPQ